VARPVVVVVGFLAEVSKVAAVVQVVVRPVA
jgi:hypothetical protein